MCKGKFIYIDGPGQHDIIQLRCALVVLDKKKIANNTDPEKKRVHFT